MNQAIDFDIRTLENFVLSNDNKEDNESLKEIDRFLSIVNILGGNLPILKGMTKIDNQLLSSNRELLLEKIYSRISTAIISVILNTNEYTPEIERLFINILAKKSYLTAILNSNITGSTDHYISALINKHQKIINNKSIHNRLFLLKLSCIYSLNSFYSIKKILGFYTSNKNYLLHFVFGLLSENFVGTTLAEDNRDYLLELFPSILDNIHSKEDIVNINVAQLAGPYMYCSYSSAKFRHKIKHSIHKFIRKFHIGFPLYELEEQKLFTNKTIYPKFKEKYSLFIIHENLTSNHAMFRCYEKLIKAFSSEFYTIGICSFSTKIDEKAKSIFNEHYSLDGDNLNEKLKSLSILSRKFLPRLIYYPSIGMDPLLIITSSYRIGYKQVYTHGHPAPVMSPVFDAAIFESKSNIKDDLDPFVKYILCDNYAPMSLIKSSIPISSCWKILSDNYSVSHSKQVNIAISASPSKLTAKFLKMINNIAISSKYNIKFYFFVAGPRLVVTQQIKNLLKEIAQCSYTVINNKPYDEYLKELGNCQIFLSPFPFGSSNTLIDCLRVGLLGPCLSGNSFPQNSERIIYQKLNLDTLIANSEEEYLQLSLELINSFFDKPSTKLIDFLNQIQPQQLINSLCNTSEKSTQDTLFKGLDDIF